MTAPAAPHAWLHLDGRAIDPELWATEIAVAKFSAETTRQVKHDLMGGVDPVWDDFVHHHVDPDNWAHEAGNLLTTAGLNLLGQLFIGSGGTAFNNAHAIVGVGSSTTAAVVGDTHLGGDGSTTTAYYQQADSSYPSQSNGIITINCTYGSSVANFAWQEFGCADGTGTITAGGTLASVATSPVFINHKVVSLGTKTSGASWTAQITITES